MEFLSKSVFKLVLLGALLFAGPLSYATYPGFSLGLQGINKNYEEPDIMSEKGNLFGVYAAFMNPPIEKLSFRVHGYFVMGSMDYTGALYNRNTGQSTPHTTSTKDSILEIQPDIGVLINPEGFLLLRLYAGLGVRLWQDEIEGVGGYRRHTTYLYLPVGVMGSAQLGSNVELSIEAQYNLWIRGNNKSYLSDVGGNEDPEFKQNSGRGYQLSLQATAYSVNYRPFLRLSYQSWDVEDSEYVIAAGGIWLEPKNETQVVMATLGFMLF